MLGKAIMEISIVTDVNYSGYAIPFFTYFEFIMCNFLLQGNRDESTNVDMSLVQRDVQVSTWMIYYYALG